MDTPISHPVTVTIPVEHVGTLRIDLLTRLAIEADGVEGQAEIERRGYGYDPDLIAGEDAAACRAA